MGIFSLKRRKSKMPTNAPDRSSDKIPCETAGNDKIASYPYRDLGKEAITYSQDKEFFTGGYQTRFRPSEPPYPTYPSPSSTSTPTYGGYTPISSTPSIPDWTRHAEANHSKRNRTPVAPSPLTGPSKTLPKRLDVSRRVISLIVVAIIFSIVVKLFYFSSSSIPECMTPSGEFPPSGPIIAIMGGTGTGKSSFIRDLGGRDSSGCLPKIGHGIQSCNIYPYYNSAILWVC
jgi:hypothetical protein